MAMRSILHLRPVGVDPGGEEPAGLDPLSDFCRRITPAWEFSSGGAYLDLTGTERLYGTGIDGAANVGRLARDTGANVVAGAAPTRLAAGLASLTAARIGGGVLAIFSLQVAVFLQSFPVDFLPGRRSLIERLHRLGVRTLGDLQVVPQDLLRSVFGEDGSRLSDEAWGRESGFAAVDSRSPAAKSVDLELVAGVRVARPVSSDRLGSAVCRGLAVRALTLCPGGPASRGKWRLTARYAAGRSDSSSVQGSGPSGWKSWLGLVELLWNRLSRRRQGLLGVELHAESSCGSTFLQGHLYPADEADRRLEEVLRLSRCGIDSRLGPASEDLLASRGAIWYGPEIGRSKPARGLVDGRSPAR